MTQVNEAEPAHYDHGPSSAHRWMNCPGSIQAEAGYPDETTDAADEGTAAHWLLEQCLRSGNDAQVWFDNATSPVVPAGEETGCEKAWPITGEMIEAVQLAIDEVNQHARKKGTRLWVEDRVRLDDTLGLPVPVGGTCDIRLYLPRSKTLIVLDFKYGRGHVVEVRDKDGGINEQLGLYALGALYAFEREHPDREVKWIQFGIVQPRARHKKGPVRTYKAAPTELMALEMRLVEAVPATLAPDAPRIPGEKQCTFCKAKRDCPAHAEWRGEQARSEFASESGPEHEDGEWAEGWAERAGGEPTGGEPTGGEPTGGEPTGGEPTGDEAPGQVIASDRDGVPAIQLPTLPPASAMTLDQLGKVQPALKYLKDWVKAVEEETKTRLLHDLAVPGKRLAQGPSSRSWANEPAARAVVGKLLADGSVKSEDCYPPKTLKSVPQIEKALGKQRFKELLGDQVSYLAGGPVVVDTDSDKPDYVKPLAFEADKPAETEEAPEPAGAHLL